MNILFWNLAGNKNHIDNSQYVTECLVHYDIDIAVFSEIEGTDFQKICTTSSPYQIIPGKGGCKKLAILSKKTINIDIHQEDSRYSIFKAMISSKEYIFAGIHLHDRRNDPDGDKRVKKIERLIDDIMTVQASTSCNSVIVIGDFNSDPYDRELLQYNAFNSALFKDVLKHQETRLVDEEEYSRFYNPILHYLSEDTKMYGSFYETGGTRTPVWHCLDQVLLSSGLEDDLLDMSYLKTTGTTSLTTGRRPKSSISDHLPLYVKMR